MLEEKFQELHDKLDQVLSIHKSLPKWYPITKMFAIECGYKTMDGLRRWCISNLPPSDFMKHGKHWYISANALPTVKIRKMM